MPELPGRDRLRRPRPAADAQVRAFREGQGRRGPARQDLRASLLSSPGQALRLRPHRAVRPGRSRSRRPDLPQVQPRAAVPTSPSTENSRRLALLDARPRYLPLARSSRTPLPTDTRRHTPARTDSNRPRQPTHEGSDHADVRSPDPCASTANFSRWAPTAARCGHWPSGCRRGSPVRVMVFTGGDSFDAGAVEAGYVDARRWASQREDDAFAVRREAHIEGGLREPTRRASPR